MVDDGKTFFFPLLTWLLSRVPRFLLTVSFVPVALAIHSILLGCFLISLCATHLAFSDSSFPSFSSSPRPPPFSSPTRPFVHSFPAPKQGRFCSLGSLSPLYIVLFIRLSVWIWIHALYTPCSQRHALHPHLDFRSFFFFSSLYSIRRPPNSLILSIGSSVWSLVPVPLIKD